MDRNVMSRQIINKYSSRKAVISQYKVVSKAEIQIVWTVGKEQQG